MLTREKAWDLLFCDASLNKHNEIESFVYNNEIWHFWRFFYYQFVEIFHKINAFFAFFGAIWFSEPMKLCELGNQYESQSKSLHISFLLQVNGFILNQKRATNHFSSTGKFDNQSNHFNFTSFPMNCIIHCSDRESGQNLTKSTRTHFAKENCEFWIDIPPTKWISFPSTEIDQ